MKPKCAMAQNRDKVQTNLSPRFFTTKCSLVAALQRRRQSDHKNTRVKRSKLQQLFNCKKDREPVKKTGVSSKKQAKAFTAKMPWELKYDIQQIQNDIDKLGVIFEEAPEPFKLPLELPQELPLELRNYIDKYIDSTLDFFGLLKNRKHLLLVEKQTIRFSYAIVVPEPEFAQRFDIDLTVFPTVKDKILLQLDKYGRIDNNELYLLVEHKSFIEARSAASIETTVGNFFMRKPMLIVQFLLILDALIGAFYVSYNHLAMEEPQVQQVSRWRMIKSFMFS